MVNPLMIPSVPHDAERELVGIMTPFGERHNRSRTGRPAYAYLEKGCTRSGSRRAEATDEIFNSGFAFRPFKPREPRWVHAPKPLVRALYLVHTVCQLLDLVGPLDCDAGEERHKEIEKQ